MARLLYDNHWFDPVATEAMYEDDFERILVANAAELFPTYRLVPFKCTVYSDLTSARPDFALVGEYYADWWVVEAELGHHSFEGHVRPQIATLTTASYGETEAHHLHRNAPQLDLDRLKAMIKGHPPRTLVIVNGLRPDWSLELGRYGASVTFIEVFRSRLNRYVYRVSGETPQAKSRIATTCTVELSRMLRLHSPGVLNVADGEAVRVRYGSGATEWRRLDIADAVYLISDRPVPLAPRARYELAYIAEVTYELRLLD